MRTEPSSNLTSPRKAYTACLAAEDAEAFTENAPELGWTGKG